MDIIEIPATTLLLSASDACIFSLVKMALDAGADVNSADEAGSTALLLVAKKLHDDLINLIQVDRITKLVLPSNALNILIENTVQAYIDTIKMLLEAGSDVDAASENGLTALMMAVQIGQCDVVKLLLAHKASTNQPHADGDTPLIMASLNGHCYVVSLLLEAGAAVNAADRKGWTALMSAAQNGHCDIVMLLVAYGAEIDQGNHKGRTALIQASQNGHCDVVKLLLEHKAKTDEPDTDGDTPLIMASQNGHCDVVKLVLEHKAKTDEPDTDGDTPLIMASLNGHCDVVKLLLEHKAKADQPDASGNTPLIIASLNGHCDVVSLLLEAGAAVNAANGKGWTALMSGAQNGHCDIVKVLIDYSAQKDQGNNTGRTALIQASQNGHWDVVKLLIEHKAKTDQPNADGDTPLIIASLNGHCDVVSLLLEDGAVVNAADGKGWTALMAAAQNGHYDIVMLLVAFGAEIDQGNHKGQTALIQASQNGHCDVVKLLLEHKANADQADANGNTPLIKASLNGHCDVVSLLLEAGAAVKAANGEGWTALMSAAQNDHCDIVRLLVAYGAEIDQGNHKGQTALIQASQNGHCDVVKLLLEHKAKTDEPDTDGDTPLIMASQNGHCDVVKLVLEHKAKTDEPDTDGDTPLIMASLNGHCDVVPLLLEAGAAVNAANGKGWTALMLASQNGHCDIVKLLVDYSAEIDQGNHSGRTALMQASQNGHCDVGKLLLEHKAKTDQSDDTGDTPLIIASLNGHCDVVSLLLEDGAVVNAADGKGWTALMAASQNGHCDIVKLLVDYSAEIDQGNHSGQTALMQASQNGHCDVVKLLLEHKAKTDQSDDTGNTPLIMASLNGHCDVVSLLLEDGAAVNAVDGEGWTALMSAAHNGHCDIVKVLIDYSAVVNAAGRKGFTALMAASNNGQCAVVRLLLESGADVNAGKMNYWSRGEITSKLVYLGTEDEDVESVVRQGDGSTPLLFACGSNHWGVVEVLLDAGANILHSNKIGENPLMYFNHTLWPVAQQQQKLILAETSTHLLECSPFGTMPLSDFLMASVVYNQSLSLPIKGPVPEIIMENCLYGFLPDRFFDSIKAVGSDLPTPYSGIEGKIALHTVGTAITCKAPNDIIQWKGVHLRAGLMNMLRQTALHLLAMENHYISRSWMVLRLSSMIEQGYSFSDCDINGRTSYHIACICRNGQFLLCAKMLDPNFIYNMNIRDNVQQRAIDYSVQYWRNTSRSSLVEFCSIFIGKNLLHCLGEVSQRQALNEAECLQPVHSTSDKFAPESHFVHDMSTWRLLLTKRRFAETAFENSMIRHMFQDRPAVVRLDVQDQEHNIITVLGLLHCIGKEMQKQDKLFECIPILKGSILEQTKCGALDELDLSMNLVNFTDQFKLHLTDSKFYGLQGKVEQKPNCSNDCNFHSVQFCCQFWLHFLRSLQGDTVKDFLCQNRIAIESCHRKHGFSGTMFVTCESLGTMFVTCDSLGHIPDKKSEPISIAVDVIPVIKLKEYLCLLHVRHYDNKQEGLSFPKRLELSSSELDWNLMKYVPQEVLCGYTLVKLLRSMAKTFQDDSSKRTLTADNILPSYMVKSSLLWVLDPDDKFSDEYKWICTDEIFQSEERSAYKNDVLYLCRNLIDHSRICKLSRHKDATSCLSADDVIRLQEIAAKCASFKLDLSGRDRIFPYVLTTQRNTAHHCVQNGINVEQLWEKVYQRLATQGIPQVNTDDDVIYNREYYSESERNVVLDNKMSETGGYPKYMERRFLGEDTDPERESYPDISLEMARKCRVWALRALRLIVLLLKDKEDIKNYYLPHQLVNARDVDLTIGLCEAFIALLS